MFTVTKRMEIAGSHKLTLDYESKCQNLHGHNWIITAHCQAKALNHNGMVVDFTDIKKFVMSYDHKHLNECIPFNTINPTAENMAKYLCHKIPDGYKVEVQESEGNIAVYEKDI